jgi:hypothetical protein
MNFHQQESSISAGRDVNSNNFLNQGTLINIAPASGPSSLPPLPRCPLPSKNFLGRSKELEKLDEFFFADENHGQKKVFSLVGMGGSGKSQIAFKFIHARVLSKFPSSHVFFVDATNTATLESSLIAIAKSKGCGASIQDALGWISHSPTPCFVLLDNADSSETDLRDYLPRSLNSLILITSRLRNTSYQYGTGPDSAIHLGDLSPDEAVQLLIMTARLAEDKLEQAALLVKVFFPVLRLKYIAGHYT